MNPPSPQTRVNTLRLKGGFRDALAAQLALAPVLAGALEAPAGVSPAGILVLRRLADPAPGRLRLGRRGAGPAAWQAAVRAALAEHCRQACRPAQGAVPAGAQAVLFADRAELLACLSLDWLRGGLAQSWWWRSLFRHADLAETALGLWVSEPELAPAALGFLAGQGKATALVRSLQPAEARALALAVARRFGLGGLASVLESPPIRAGEVSTSVDAPEPWQAWAPESRDPALDLPRRILLGLALGLARVPAAVRAPAFAQAVARCLAADAGTAPAQTDGVFAADGQTLAQPKPWFGKTDATGFGPASSGDIGPDQTPKPARPEGQAESDIALADTGQTPFGQTAGDSLDRPPSHRPLARPTGDEPISPSNGEAGVQPSAPKPGHPAHGTEARAEPVFPARPLPKPTTATPGQTASDAGPGSQSPEDSPSAGQGLPPESAPPPLPDTLAINRMAAALAPLPGTEEGRKKPPAAEPAVALAGFVETDFGGVFYLLNIALYLDLDQPKQAPESGSALE